jgi:hypothetical protein
LTIGDALPAGAELTQRAAADALTIGDALPVGAELTQRAAADALTIGDALPVGAELTQRAAADADRGRLLHGAKLDGVVPLSRRSLPFGQRRLAPVLAAACLHGCQSTQGDRRTEQISTERRGAAELAFHKSSRLADIKPSEPGDRATS